MTSNEAGKVLKVCGGTIKRWIKGGYLEATKKKPTGVRGGRWYWDVSMESINGLLRRLNGPEA